MNLGAFPACLSLVLTAAPALAQAPAPDAAPVVHLVTIAAGPAIWERFGHNALVVEDSVSGTAVAYDWGRFDFGEEGFVLRFVRGRMRYWMAASDAHRLLDFYQRSGREVRLQTLDLDPAESRALARLLRANDTEASRYYRYDYYLDNCSTRVRDALDTVLGGALRHSLEGRRTGRTFRSHTRRLLTGMPLTLTGMDVLLGPAADRELSAWEEGFLPTLLAAEVGALTRPGTNRPVVLRDSLISGGSGQPERAEAPRWWPYFLVAGLAFGAVLALASGRLLVLLGGAWGVLSGHAGLVALLMWGFTDHAVVAGNLNVFLLPCSGLVLAGLLGRGGKGLKVARVLAALAVALGLVAVATAAFGAVPQDLRRVAALALPAHMGLLLALWRQARRDEVQSRRESGDIALRHAA